MTLVELQHSIIIQSDVKADLGNRPFIIDKVQLPSQICQLQRFAPPITPYPFNCDYFNVQAEALMKPHAAAYQLSTEVSWSVEQPLVNECQYNPAPFP
jgi:hypothetical protein